MITAYIMGVVQKSIEQEIWEKLRYFSTQNDWNAVDVALLLHLALGAMDFEEFQRIHDVYGATDDVVALLRAHYQLNVLLASAFGLNPPVVPETFDDPLPGYCGPEMNSEEYVRIVSGDQNEHARILSHRARILSGEVARSQRERARMLSHKDVLISQCVEKAFRRFYAARQDLIRMHGGTYKLVADAIEPFSWREQTIGDFLESNKNKMKGVWDIITVN